MRVETIRWGKCCCFDSSYFSLLFVLPFYN